jgi:hypothetical protein
LLGHLLEVVLRSTKGHTKASQSAPVGMPDKAQDAENSDESDTKITSVDVRRLRAW